MWPAGNQGNGEIEIYWSMREFSSSTRAPGQELPFLAFLACLAFLAFSDAAGPGRRPAPGTLPKSIDLSQNAENDGRHNFISNYSANILHSYIWN